MSEIIGGGFEMKLLSESQHEKALGAIATPG